MRITFRKVMLAGFVLFGFSLVSCNLVHPLAPSTCCGDPRSTPPVSIRFSQQIATRVEEVPVELQGCGANHEEITAISIHGTLAACVSVSGSTMKFPDLVVDFTTSGARCGGSQAVITGRSVSLTDVNYTNTIRSNRPPSCVIGSSVTWNIFNSADPGFATLFATRGPQTLLPILDRYVLGWLASIPRPSPTVSPSPPPTCPPVPTFGGATSRCP